jgi:hypothetical protein
VDDGRGARAEATAPRGGILLVLAPLLVPHRRHGQLSIRIERLPNGARLSKGQNNGDRTWSLRSDDLEDVLYQPPEGLADAHTLAIRILSLDADHAATLAVLDLPVSPADARVITPPAAAAALSSDPTGQNDAELRRLRDQLTELTARLGVREAELAEARQKLEHMQSASGAKQVVEAELASARAQWEAELKEKLAATEAEAANSLATSRDAWQAEQGGRFAELEKRADEQIQLAQQRWQQDAKAATAQAEANWKTGEAARLATAISQAEATWKAAEANRLATATSHAEASWKSSETTRYAAAEANWKAAEAARLATAMSQAEATWKAGEAARHAAAEVRWRDESMRALADAEARVKRTEAALAQARPEEQVQKARDAWQQEAKAALTKAEEAWKANEAARFASAEAGWREDSRRALAEAEMRVARAETALERQEKGAPPPPVERNAKADENARLLSAETRRREQAERALADTRLRADQAEAALAQIQGKSQGDAIEIHVLHDELREVKAQLAVRESQLAQVRSSAERPGESDHITKQRQLSDQLIAQLRNETGNSPVPPPREGGFGRRLFGFAVLFAIVVLGYMYYPQIEAMVLQIWQPNAVPRYDTSASRTKAPAHRASPDGSRLP